jgi:hypothetical protein
VGTLEAAAVLEKRTKKPYAIKMGRTLPKGYAGIVTTGGISTK